MTTLAVYAGLIGGLFFVGLYLQQVVGYSAFEAGLATTPISLLLFFLSPRFGRLASGTGPRVPMTARPDRRRPRHAPLLRVGPDAPYLTDVLPAVLVFGLGLSATVAPLTATVLDSVAERRVGIASGVNNGVSRVAGLLAIAVLGAVISAHFGSAGSTPSWASRPLGPGRRAAPSPKPRNSRSAVPDERRPAAGEATRRQRRRPDASTSAFHLGALLGGAADDHGGVASWLGIENPEAARRRGGAAGRRVRPASTSPMRVRAGVSMSRPDHLLRHPADRPQAPRQLHRRDPPVRRGPGPRRPGDLLRRRPALDLGRLRPRRPARARLRHRRDPARRRPRPRALHLLPPVRRARAHRADLAALRGHLPRRPQPDDPVQGKVGEARELASAALFYYPVLMAADVLAYRATRCRSATTSASTSS